MAAIRDGKPTDTTMGYTPNEGCFLWALAAYDGVNVCLRHVRAGAAPPAAVIEAMKAMEFRVTHVYGLTETYGPSVACEWKVEWDCETPEQRARLKSRQGVRAPLLDGLMVADPDSLEPVPKDGQTIGEIMMRGNVVMKGYLKKNHGHRRGFRRRLVPLRRPGRVARRRLRRD